MKRFELAPAGDQHNRLFIAVGHDGLRLVSPDGRTWSEPQLGKEGETYSSIATGAGRVVIAGRYGGSSIYAASSDGSNWTTGSRDAKYVRYIRGLGFGQGGELGDRTFVAVGGDPGAVGAASPFSLVASDGLDWSDYHEDMQAKFILRRLAFGNGRFIGVGDRGRRAASTDGLHWTDAPDPKPLDTLIDVAFGAGVFVGVGLHGLRMTTNDGLTWTDRQTGREGEHLNSVLWTGDQFVAVGQGATYLSPNGRTWTRHENTNAPLTATFGNSRFVGSAWKGRLLTSVDGITWEEVHRAVRHIETVAYATVDAGAVTESSPAS